MWGSVARSCYSDQDDSACLSFDKVGVLFFESN